MMMMKITIIRSTHRWGNKLNNVGAVKNKTLSVTGQKYARYNLHYWKWISQTIQSANCASQATNTKKLTLSWRSPLSYRNQSIDLGSKSMDWFLYDNGLRHERVVINNKTMLKFKISRRRFAFLTWNITIY